MKLINKILILTTIICFLSGYLFSQKIPFVNNIQHYNIKEGKIAEMHVNIFNVNDKNGNISTSELRDYPVTIYFDSLGNRVKEKLYSLTGDVEFIKIWDYDTKNNIVGIYKLDTLNRQILKKIVERDEKTHNVIIKDYNKGDTLVRSEKWLLGATGKSIIFDKYNYDIDRGIIVGKISRSFELDKNSNIEHFINQFSITDEYAWLPTFIEDWNNSKNRSTRTEKLFNDNVIKYVYDKKKQLMLEKNKYDPKGTLIEKISYNYEFDGNGNWTKVTQFLNDRPYVIAIRTFKYNTSTINTQK